MADGALTKADMAERLFEELGLNKREAKEVVEQFFEEIRLSSQHRYSPSSGLRWQDRSHQIQDIYHFDDL